MFNRQVETLQADKPFEVSCWSAKCRYGSYYGAWVWGKERFAWYVYGH